MIKVFALFLFTILSVNIIAQNFIESVNILTDNPHQYEKTEFEINLTANYINPYISHDIMLDMLLASPSGREFILPCFYVEGDAAGSTWNARFAPQEAGEYSYKFNLSAKDCDPLETEVRTFNAAASSKDGFLHANDFWTLKFDSGKLFRGIGENVGWESRSYEDPKWTYDYLLPTLSDNGANFFRTWMCSWNLPLDWQKTRNTNRYQDTDEYYNPGGIKRLDELVEMCDSLGLYIMLTLETTSNLNSDRYTGQLDNKHDASAKTKFFTLGSARDKYKDKLRYIVARWGYSTSIAAWEFFNEIDNGVYTRSDSVIVEHPHITEWHSEMSRYLTDIDPYDHLITTSISHRDIIGMNSLPFIDLNQKHIYKRTGKMRDEIFKYIATYNKPYTIGEFGYEWDWNIDFSTITEGLNYDYKRGLWYGLFSPTPILPMTWWWEFFDEQDMTPYFQSVRKISDMMLESGEGSFEILGSSSGNIESYAVKCGEDIYIYLLNNSSRESTESLSLNGVKGIYNLRSYNPASNSFDNLGKCGIIESGIVKPGFTLDPKSELVLILSSDSANK